MDCNVYNDISTLTLGRTAPEGIVCVYIRALKYLMCCTCILVLARVPALSCRLGRVPYLTCGLIPHDRALGILIVRLLSITKKLNTTTEKDDYIGS